MTTLYERRAAPPVPPVPPAARRSPAGPLLALLWAGAAAALAAWWLNADSVVGTAGWLTNAGRIAGLLCGYACAVLVGLMARVPVLERRIGSDRVTRWHAMAGRYTVCLLVAHIVLILAGYAAQDGASFVHETLTVVLDYPEMLKATVGTLILFAAGITSARAVRRRLGHELWYHVHLLTYAAVFLSFFHQVQLGTDLTGGGVAQAAWYALYLGVAALVVWFRVLAPVRLNLRHRLRVESVHREAAGVWSVVVRGRRLDRLGARAGQFFRWRFLTEGMRWTSTPYSLSAPPRHDLMRITVKSLGDHSAAIPLLRPGTRVWAEGPYGSLTADRRTAPKSLLIGGGVGITRSAPCSRPCRARSPCCTGRAGPRTWPWGRAGGHRAVARREGAVRAERGGRAAPELHRRVPARNRPRPRGARRLPLRAARFRPRPVRGVARGRCSGPPYPPRVVRALRTAETVTATRTVTAARTVRAVRQRTVRPEKCTR